MEVHIPALDDLTARAVGYLSGVCGHPDVVGVHVMFHAREHGHHVVTSDPGDLARVHPTIPLIVV